jgi:hypothetical protein
VAAEKISHEPGNPGAKDYLLSLRSLKRKRGVQPILKEPVKCSTQSFQFYRDDYRGEVNGVAMSQAIFVTVQKGYAVIFSFTGEDEKNVEEMLRVMESVLPFGIGGGDLSLPPTRKPN